MNSESPQKKASKDSLQTTTSTTSTPYNNSYYSSANSSAYYGNNQYGTQSYSDGYGYNQVCERLIIYIFSKCFKFQFLASLSNGNNSMVLDMELATGNGVDMVAVDTIDKRKKKTLNK